MKAIKSISWQRWLFAGLVLAFLWVLVQRFAEIQQLVGTLATGHWPWILTAIGLELAYYVAFAALFKSAFDLTEISTRMRDLIPISFAFLFANTTMASGGTAGLALFVDDARRRGGSIGRATAGTLLAHTANYGMFAVLLSLGIFFLFLQNDLTSLELMSALILFLLVFFMCGVLVLGLRWPDGLLRLLQTIQDTGNRIGSWLKRPSFFPANWAEKSTKDFLAASQAIAAHPRRVMRLILLALLTHGIHLLVLLALFFAFNQPVTPGVLLAGYTISLLFMIVSPTPNGIGIVETLVPIMYRSLGIPVEIGLVITLAFRGITFWIPMIIGFVLLRQLHMFGGGGTSLAESGQVRLLAILTGLMGAINVLSAVRPTLLIHLLPLTQLSPVAVQQGSRVTAVVSGFMLLVLARGLWRHKRAAWWLTIVVLTMAMINHLLREDYMTAALGVLLILFMITQRTHFRARSDPPSVWQGIQVLLAATAFTLVYGIVGYYLLDAYFGQPFSLQTAWQQTLLLFTTLSEPTLIPQTPFDYFADSIYLVGLGTVLYAFFMLLRPVLTTSPSSRREQLHAQAIVAEYGRSTLSALISLPNYSYYFTPGGSVIAFEHYKRVAVALGDPVGPEADRLAAVIGFREFCRLHDWLPVFYYTPSDMLEIYQASGFDAMEIGQDINVDLCDFSLPENIAPGYVVNIHEPPHAGLLLEQLRLVSDEWLEISGEVEHPFSSGWYGKPFLQKAILGVVSDAKGTAVAILAAVTLPVQDALMVSWLRYRRRSTDTVVQVLLGTLAQWAKQHDFSRLNLGLSPLLTDTPHPNRSWLFKLMRALLRQRHRPTNPLPDLTSMFQPRRLPRYLILPGPASLPTVNVALKKIVGDML